MTTIHVFTTGGTISSISSDGAAARPTLSGSDVLQGVHAAGIDLVVHEREPRPSNWLDIGDAVSFGRDVDAAARRGADAALIIQGTDSLEETGFVVEISRESAIPVALTGAMRTPGSASADGAGNIASALAYLRTAESRSVAVVMNDEAHPARWVRKQHTILTSAFSSAPYGPLGLIVEGAFCSYRASPTLLQPINATQSRRVLLVTASLGERFEWLPGVASRYGGLVVDGMGAGHLNKQAAECVADLAKRMPVVIASRTLRGPIPVNTYGYVGSEVFFARAGAALVRNLDGLRARLLLSFVPGDTTEDVVAAFKRADDGFSATPRPAADLP